MRRKEVAPSELLAAAIERAEAVNPRLNAIVTPFYELAHKRCEGPLTGALAGVPFLLKDLFQHHEGVPSSGGNAALKRMRWTPHEHAEITRRWLAGGLVPFGMTNTPEFGAKGITEPDAWGPARNPWHSDHTPGGSSGGSASAVAAGIVPAAGANDGGGSSAFLPRTPGCSDSSQAGVARPTDRSAASCSTALPCITCLPAAYATARRCSI